MSRYIIFNVKYSILCMHILIRKRLYSRSQLHISCVDWFHLSGVLHTRYHKYFIPGFAFVDSIVIVVNIVVIVIFCCTCHYCWLIQAPHATYTYPSLSIFHQHDIPSYYWTLREITGESKSTLFKWHS